MIPVSSPSNRYAACPHAESARARERERERERVCVYVCWDAERKRIILRFFAANGC